MKFSFLNKRVLMFIFLFHSTNLLALSYPTDVEMVYLPPYCQARNNFNTNDRNKRMWEKKFGRKAWGSLHHYCQYVNGEHRYYKQTDKKRRKLILEEIISGIQRTIPQVGPDFILMHEAYYRIAEAYERLGKSDYAIIWYDKSLKNQPKYTRAYGSLSDLYRESGKLDKALEIVDKGLVIVPKSKLLNRKKAELLK